MTWTYTNDPANSPRDAVRLVIGDVLADDPQLTDQELDYIIARNATPLAAAIEAVRTLQALFTRRVDKAVGDLRLSLSQKAKQYAELFAALTSEQNLQRRTTVSAIAGGISLARKDTVDSDPDRTPMIYKPGEFDHPGS